MTKSIEETYIKHEPIEAILTRPQIYIGNDQKQNEIMYIYNEIEEKMFKKDISYSPGFIKIFDEVISNAIDHSTEDPNMTYIKVNIDQKTGIINVLNNGNGIPVKIHKTYNKYVPELIFGELNTSSNYDDTQKRIKSGLNGVGIKLTNIFSKYFKIETVDTVTKKKFIQEYSDNMYNKKQPKITDSSLKGYTSITFLPDYSRFQMSGLDTDSYQLLIKRVYDSIPCTNKNVSVYLNGVKLKGNDFLGYIKYYPVQNIIGEIEQETIEGSEFLWEIYIGKNATGTFEQVSFVNGVSTTRGGTHINYITNQIIKKLTELIEKKQKLKNIKAQNVKENLFIFVKMVTENPKFSSQTKEELSTQSKDFTIKYKVSDDFIQKIYKKNTELIKEIIDLTNYKNNKELSKNDGSSTKRTTHLNIPKLDDAHYAGTRRSKDCTLILVEGDSAKQFAVEGVGILNSGRDYFGIFPLKGKVLNVKKASQSQCSNNEELNKIKKIIGLEHGKKYTSSESLRYGKILLLTDADVDGIHISGLFINMIHTWWPELFNIPGFINSLRTPIIKVSNGNQVIKEFYSQYEYTEWEKDNMRNSYTVKYYKGLGSSGKNEVREIFNEYSRNLMLYSSDPDSNNSINLAFNEKLADDRKLWLKDYKKENILDYAKNNITYTEFINNGLIHFSMSDNLRSIPGIDGLKPSQRKILHTLFEKVGKESQIKVSNFASKVSEYTDYKHGEVSLQGAIITMAQDYIGSNNYPLLEPIGQFGTRVTGEAASPRYIFTKMSRNAELLFHKDDFNVLNYLEEENKRIEPEYYVPLIPICLLNGAEGIGTGYSTFIPSYNLKDIVENINIYLKTKDISQMDTLTPWFRYFKGDIEVYDENKYILYGDYKIISENKLKITELPVGVLTDRYKDDILKSKLLETGIIKSIKENSTTEDIDIEIEFTEKNYLKNTNSQDINKLLKLSRIISCTNFHLFDKNYNIKYYHDANEILVDFIDLRLEFYKKRREYLIENYSKILLQLNNKIRFLIEIMDDTLVIYKKGNNQVNELLEKNKYDKINNSYSYLRSMQIDSFTKEKLEKLVNEKNEITKQKEYIVNTTEIKMYIEDLKHLLKNVN